MKKDTMHESGMGYLQGNARDFTPITVSADFAALQCIPSWNDSAEGHEDPTVPIKNAA